MCEQVGISLGWNCFPAGMGVKMGIRKRKAEGYNTCPFDECISNYPGVVECMADDFKYFTDVNHLKVIPAEFTCGGIIKVNRCYTTHTTILFSIMNHQVMQTCTRSNNGLVVNIIMLPMIFCCLESDTTDAYKISDHT